MSDNLEIQVVDSESDIPQAELLEIVGGTDLEELVADLKGKYDAAKTNMESRNKKLVKWRKNMEAVASDAPKNKPIKNASNVNIPVTQTVTGSLYAQIMGTFLAQDPFWSIEGSNLDEEGIQMYKVIEKYLDMLLRSPYDIGIGWLYDFVDETLLAGGAFSKVTYDTNSWRVMDAEGGDREVVNHDGPTIGVVPLENVVYPLGIPNIQRLPWFAVDIPLTEMELRERAAKGTYDAAGVEAILDQGRTSPTDQEEQEQIAELFTSGEVAGLFDVSEVSFYYDIAKDGVPVDLLFTVHFPTGTVLKQQYNTIGQRCLVPSKYAHRSRSISGRGTGQMTESFQAEITSLHNMRIDNAKVSGMRMIIMKRGSKFGINREVYPGAVWEADNPRDDVMPFQLGEVYPSSLQAENLDWGLVHKTVGLSETQMGFADSTMGSRDTVRGQAMRMERGDTILGSAVGGMKASLSEVGMLVWMQLIANRDRVIAREKQAMRLSEEEQAILFKALEMEITEVPLKIKFVVKTTEAEKTYEQRRMNVMTLTQIFTQFSKETIPLAMQLFGPQGQQMQAQMPQLWNYLGRILVGSGKLMEDTFKFFGTYDVNNYVPNPKMMDQMLDTMAQAFVGAQQAGSGFAGAPVAQGMEQQAVPQGVPPEAMGIEQQQGGMTA